MNFPTVFAPAKINTFLSVGPADARGWHPLRSIFQAISLCDELQFVESDHDEVVFDIPGIPADNTVTKALLKARELGPLPFFRIEIKKQIPAESGLGGGSSDAAAVLRVAKLLWGESVHHDDLMRVAATIGADVPFFLIGGRAMAEGYGEILTPLEDTPPQCVAIVRPEVGCSTPAMYRALDEVHYEWKPITQQEAIYNDFERVAPCECIDLIEQIQMDGATCAGLSGSGSAVFAYFDSEEAAQKAIAKRDYSFSAICRTLTRNQSIDLRE